MLFSKKRPTVVFVANDVISFLHHRKHLLDHAVKSGWRPVLVGDTADTPSQMPCEHVPISIERFKFHISDIGLFFCVLRLVLSERPKILHLVSIKPYLYGGLAARLARLLGWRGRVIATVPGLGRLYDDQRSTIKARLRRNMVESLLRFAMKGAVVSFETGHDRDFWIDHGNVTADQTIVTKGTGVDFGRFAPPTQQRNAEQLRVLYAGRLLRSKGLDVFLDTASLNSDPSIQMIVAGQCDEKDPDAISAKELLKHPGVTFIGAIADMPSLLADIDVVVLPSRYNEGIPRILLEAAACECVPVATRFPGSLELIQEGETGYFIHSKNPKEQVLELLHLLEEIRRNQKFHSTVGVKASNYVRKNGFSAEDVTAAFYKIYGAAELSQPT